MWAWQLGLLYLGHVGLLMMAILISQLNAVFNHLIAFIFCTTTALKALFHTVLLQIVCVVCIVCVCVCVHTWEEGRREKGGGGKRDALIGTH